MIKLGGIRMPMPPEAATIAVANSFEYPRLTISGIMTEPIAAVSAVWEPEIPENM